MNLRPFFRAAILLCAFALVAFSQKKIPIPKWKSGYTAFYLVRLKSDRNIKAKSAIFLPNAPSQSNVNVRGVLQLQILDAKNPGTGAVQLHTHFVDFRENSGEGIVITPTSDKFVDVMLQRDGQLLQITGLSELPAEQQNAWREWAAQFSTTYLYETKGRKLGEKWNSEEPETSPSPIAQLLWQRKSQYVDDEPCSPVKLDPKGESQLAASKETCAVILTTASLIQKSSQQDATPQDYKLRDLRTRGGARGTNETILYISKSTGQLVRATQNANQQMAVQIALADGTNQVQYDVTASANISVELVTELTLSPHP